MIRLAVRWIWLTFVRGWLYARLGVELIRKTFREETE